MLKAKNIYGGELTLIGYINIECSLDVLCVTNMGGTTLLSQIAEIEKPATENKAMFLYTAISCKLENLKKYEDFNHTP